MSASYDPTKSYSWEPNTQFLISGRDLNLFIHLIRGILATPEASNAILAYEANKNIDSLMDYYVNQGIIKETGVNNIQVNEPEEIKTES